MDPMLTNKRLLLAKVGGGSYPDDSEPTASANAILTEGLQFTPFAGNRVERNYDRPKLGANREFMTGPHAQVSFNVDLVGSGTAGEAPPFGELLRMCGFAETVEAETSVTYNPVSEGFDWGSLYFIHENERHMLLGARGNVTLQLNAEQLPQMAFTFTGLWVPNPSALSPAPTPDFDAFKTPLPVNEANTPEFEIDGFSAPLSQLELNAGQQVEYRNLVNQEAVRITDRNGSGSMQIEAARIGDKNFWSLVAAHALVDGHLQHGNTAGNIVEIDWISQLMMNQLQDSQGIAMQPFDQRLVPTDEGDDELILTFR